MPSPSHIRVRSCRASQRRMEQSRKRNIVWTQPWRVIPAPSGSKLFSLAMPLPAAASGSSPDSPRSGCLSWLRRPSAGVTKRPKNALASFSTFVQLLSTWPLRREQASGAQLSARYGAHSCGALGHRGCCRHAQGIFLPRLRLDVAGAAGADALAPPCAPGVRVAALHGH